MYDQKSLLDRRREGQEFSIADINRALCDAGDLAHDRSTRMAEAVCNHQEDERPAECQALVGVSESGYRAQAWQGWSKYLDCRNEQAAK